MTKPTHAERKRQQRARAAAGQVHRVAVYLTEEELQAITFDGQTHDETIHQLIKYLRFSAPRQTATSGR